jgi:hypothetical protein
VARVPQVDGPFGGRAIFLKYYETLTDETTVRNLFGSLLTWYKYAQIPEVDL